MTSIPADRLLEPLGAMIVELQAYLEGHGYSAAVVRGGSLQGGDIPGPADSGQAAGLVRLTRNGGTIDRRVPIQRLRVVATCYAAKGRAGAQSAAYLANTVAAWFHDRGPRVGSSRRPLFASSVVSQGTSGTDPDTGWPFEQLVIAVVAGTASLP